MEPKTYFANERTFLKWISFAVIIQGVGISLFLQSDAWYCYLLGFLLTIISMTAMGYALYNFRWRAAHIRNQADQRFDDVSGPIALFFLMTVAVIINAAFQITNRMTAIEDSALQDYYYQ